MIEFRTLGQIDLASPPGDDAHTVNGLIKHSKPLALFAYLLLRRPSGFHRRDELVAMFWPELDHRRSRAALSQALYLLRRHLGSDVIETRGVEEIGIASDTILCDALDFRRAIEEGRPDDALNLYQGELLPGLFVSEALDFERWLDAERAALVQLASVTAWGLAESNEQEGNAVAAGHWGRRAASLTPYHEGSARRLMELLARLGDRSGALRAFEHYQDRALTELQLEPSDQIVELADRIRADVASLTPPRSASRDEPDRVSTAAAEAVSPEEALPSLPPPSALSRIPMVAAIVVVALALYGGVRLLGPSGPGDAVAHGLDRTVALLPIRPRGTADSVDAEMYSLRLADALALTGFHVAFPGSTPTLSDSVRLAYRSKTAASWLLDGDLRMDEDGPPELTIRLLDTDRDVVVWAFSFREGGRSAGDFVLHVARTTAEQLARRMGLDPEEFRVPRLTDDPVVDSLWAAGYFLSQTNYTWQGARQAAAAFRAAIERDSSFVPAYVGLAAALNSGSRIYWNPPPAETRREIERVLARALELDPSYGPLHGELGWHSYTMDWDWEQAERHYREAIALQPNHGLSRAMYAFLLIATGATDEGLAQSQRATVLAPNPLILTTYCWHLYLARRFDEAIQACDRVLDEMDPTYPVAIAIKQSASIWRASPIERVEIIRSLPELIREDTMLAAEWSGATWAAIAGDTARALEIIEAEKRHPRVRPFRVANDYAWAGQLDSAFAWLDRAFDSGDPYLPEIYVRPIMEPYRGDPRFEAALERLDLP